MNYLHIKHFTIEDIYDIKLYKEIYLIYKISKKNLPIICSRNYSSEVNNYKKSKMKIIRNNKNITFQNNINLKRAEILIAIHSHISLFYQRYAFRKVYRSYKNMQMIFFVAHDCNETLNSLFYNEMKVHKDIVLFNFISNYYNLHFLTYSFLKWLKIYKGFYNIIIKQDTDTFINFNLLNIIIKNLPQNISFVLGYIWKYNNNFKRYPSGMGYLFLSKSVNGLLKNLDREFDSVKFGFPEDMLFGKLCKAANFTFIDVRKKYNYIVYLRIPPKKFNINETYMIHWLRISEIVYFHLLCNDKLNLLIKKGKIL